MAGDNRHAPEGQAADAHAAGARAAGARAADARGADGQAPETHGEVGQAAHPLDEGETSSLYLPPFRIDVTVRPDVPHLLSRHRIAAAVRAALDAAGAPGPASLGVVLSSDRELAELNGVHMGVVGATDVLSFPFFPPEAFPAHPRAETARDHWVAAALKQAFALPPGLRAHLGDVIVSVERAVAQADEGRGGQTGDVAWGAADELLLLLVHGVLHVCGWDHAEPVEEAAMRTLEREILATVAQPAE